MTTADDAAQAAGTFADLGLRPELLQALTQPRLRGADADPARGDPAAARGPRPARPGGHRHRQDGGVRAAAAAAAARCSAAAAARPWRWCSSPTRELAMQVSRGGRTATAGTSARGSCRSTAGSRSAASCARSSAASTSSSPPRAARSTTSAAARCGLAELRTRRARRGRRDARHGVRRGHRGDPRRPTPRRGRPCCSRRRCRRASTASPAATCATRSASRSRREQAPAGEAPLVRQSAYVVARPHKPAALGRVLDVEAPGGGDRLLPHPRRGRPAHRDAQRPRLPRRGAARRHEPGAARPGHGPAARRHRRPARRHRRGRPRPRHRAAHARRQLQRPVRARGVRAPHRPGRPGRPRGRRHHAGRAARAPDAQDDRAGHRQRIAIEKVPTVADLRARRLELTRAALHESLLEDDLDALPRASSRRSPTSSTSWRSRSPR